MLLGRIDRTDQRKRQRNHFCAFSAMLAVSSCSPAAPSVAETGVGSNSDAAISETSPAIVQPIDPLALPAGPIGIATMEAYIIAVRSFKAADEFSPRKFDDSMLEGREFAFELSKQGEWPSAGLWHGYDPEKKILKLQISLANARHFQGKSYQPDFEYVPFKYTESMEGSEVGSNAFGVTGTYKVSYHERYGVGVASENSKLGLFKRDDGSYKPLEKEIPMAPDDARAATAGLRARFVGVLVRDDKYESVIACSRDKTKPSFDYPYNENWAECVVSATFSFIEIISPSAGVLASWGKE